jgi:hypothetical protein
MKLKFFSKSSSKVSPSSSTDVEHPQPLHPNPSGEHPQHHHPSTSTKTLSHKESSGSVSTKNPSLKTMPSTHSIGNGTARSGYNRSTSAVNQQQQKSHESTHLSSKASTGASTTETAAVAAAVAAAVVQIQHPVHELRYDDEDDEVDPKYLKIISPTDLTIFKSWYHITPAAPTPISSTGATALGTRTSLACPQRGGGLLISELIDRLIHYHILNPVSTVTIPPPVTAATAGAESGSESGVVSGVEAKNDVDVFLEACQLEPSDHLKFSKFIEILCETKLYEKKFINRLPSLSHRDSRAATTAAATAAAFHMKSYSMNYDYPVNQSEKKKQSSLVSGNGTNVSESNGDGTGNQAKGNDNKRNKELSRAQTTAGVGVSPSSASGMKFPKLPNISAIGKKDSLKEFFKFAKQFSFDSVDEPKFGRQESIDEEEKKATQAPTMLSNEANSTAVETQQQRSIVRKQHSINDGEEKSISRRFFGRLLSREYSTKIASVDSMDHEGGGEYDSPQNANSERRSIASYFRRRDNNMDGAVRRIGKVTIHQQER